MKRNQGFLFFSEKPEHQQNSVRQLPMRLSFCVSLQYWVKGRLLSRLEPVCIKDKLTKVMIENCETGITSEGESRPQRALSNFRWAATSGARRAIGVQLQALKISNWYSGQSVWLLNKKKRKKYMHRASTFISAYLEIQVVLEKQDIEEKWPCPRAK